MDNSIANLLNGNNKETSASETQKLKINVHRKLLERLDLNEARRMPLGLGPCLSGRLKILGRLDGIFSPATGSFQ